MSLDILLEVMQCNGTMINYALDNNIDRYNFYGISGDFTEDAEMQA
ncbi:methicillin resistance protein FemA [Staphylococcus gallinarum]|uniref:Methicillin resistance protein FemA n=1 Tax=Staphylococcus gallinarum TaxID=1293 RepID=A0A380FHR5_STAGA|nr:methicillin resistance protein FemA [Staphylococcus gallinarum]